MSHSVGIECRTFAKVVTPQLGLGVSLSFITFYRLPTKLWEGNVFTPVCPQGVRGMMSLPVWSHVLWQGGWY